MHTPEPHRPTRRFGQNFLVDRGLARWLVDAFDPQPDQAIVEIGPGRGALTALLASRAGRFVALELDRRLYSPLVEVLAPFPNAEVRCADALECDWSALSAELGSPLRVIGNLPFNVGTAIVARLLASDGVRDLQVVLQLEVAERLLAGPGCKAYGPLSVLAALRAHRRRLRRIAPGAFRPRPKVTSCALRFDIRTDAPVSAQDSGDLLSWLFLGFGRRRKQLAGVLGAHREVALKFLAARGLPLDARAEALTPEDWLALAHQLSAAGVPETGRRNL